MSVDRLLALADLYLSQNRPDVVLTTLADVFAVEPDHPSAWWLAAWAHLDQNDIPAARHAAERLLELVPSDNRGYVLLGAVLDRAGDQAGAYEAIRHAIERAPDDVWSLRWLARITRETDEGRETVRRLMVRAPADPETYSVAAEVELAHGDLDSADALIGQGLAIDPTYHDLLRVETRIKSARMVGPGSIATALNSGGAFVRQGQRSFARAYEWSVVPLVVALPVVTLTWGVLLGGALWFDWAVKPGLVVNPGRILVGFGTVLAVVALARFWARADRELRRYVTLLVSDGVQTRIWVGLGIAVLVSALAGALPTPWALIAVCGALGVLEVLLLLLLLDLLQEERSELLDSMTQKLLIGLFVLVWLVWSALVVWAQTGGWVRFALVAVTAVLLWRAPSPWGLMKSKKTG